MKANHCTCDIANNQDYWHLGMLESVHMGKCKGYVECRRCGQSWWTTAKYIHSIDGSENFRESLDGEAKRICREIQESMERFDNQMALLFAQIESLKSEKRKLETKLLKAQSRKG